VYSRFRQYVSLRRQHRRILPSGWRRRPLWAVLVPALVVAGLLLRRHNASPVAGDDMDRYHGRTFRVVRVVDGDTLDLETPDVNRDHTRVRLWGGDTPEVSASGRDAMFYGREAFEFARASLSGRDVTLLLIRGKTRDRYGRLLAYLRLPGDEQTFNERLVEEGYAYADGRFDHPYKERFLKTEHKARKQRRGLWASVRPDQMPKWRQRRERGDPSDATAPRRAAKTPEPAAPSENDAEE